MAPKLTSEKIDEIKKYIYGFFDVIDKSGTNTTYYKQLLEGMTDAQFIKFISKKYPFKFQMRQTVTEPSMDDIVKACDYTGVPLLEEIYLPYYYKDKNGNPVKTAKCMVGYNHIKKVQQIVTKKSKWSAEVSNRNMKTGRLIGQDKGTAISDREFEGLATLGLYDTMYEFAKPKGDAVRAKAAMNQAISTKGYVTQADIPNDIEDSISRNYANVCMTSALFETNLVDSHGYTAYTLREKGRQIERL
jgi:hypothetical protein